MATVAIITPPEGVPFPVDVVDSVEYVTTTAPIAPPTFRHYPSSHKIICYILDNHRIICILLVIRY